MFIWVLWVHSGAPRRLLGSVGIIRARWTSHPGSLCSLWRAMGVILFRWVHSVAPWQSSCSFGFIGSIQAHGRVHSVSLGSFDSALVVGGFNRVRWVNSGSH